MLGVPVDAGSLSCQLARVVPADGGPRQREVARIAVVKPGYQRGAALLRTGARLGIGQFGCAKARCVVRPRRPLLRPDLPPPMTAAACRAQGGGPPRLIS